MNAIHHISSALDIAGTADRTARDAAIPGLFGDVLDTVATYGDEPTATETDEAWRDEEHRPADDNAADDEGTNAERRERPASKKSGHADAAAQHVPFEANSIAGKSPQANTAAKSAAAASPGSVSARPDGAMDFSFDAPADMAAPGARMKLDAQLAQQRPGAQSHPLLANMAGMLADETVELTTQRAGSRAAADRKFVAGETALERVAARKTTQQDSAAASSQSDTSATRRSSFAERMANLAERLTQHQGAADGAQQARPQPVALPAQANALLAAQPAARAGDLPFTPPPGDSGIDSGQAAAQAAQRTIQSGHAAVQIAARTPQAPAGTPAEQVSVQIQHGLRNEGDRINVRLYPAALGKVEVKLELSPDKTVQAIVTAERIETLDMLARDARVLQRALEDAGLHTDANSLSFRHDDGGNGSAQQFAGQGDFRSPTGGEVLSGDDDAVAQLPEAADKPRRAAHDGMLDVEV